MKEQKVKITDPLGVLDRMPVKERKEWLASWKKYLRLPDLSAFNHDGPAIWLASVVPGIEDEPALLVSLVSVKFSSQNGTAKAVGVRVFPFRFDAEDDGSPDQNPLLCEMLKVIEVPA